MAWIHDIYIRTGIIVPFPVIADRSGEIARQYGMISNTISSTGTVRNVFIIDDKGIVRTILVYPMNVGRCIPEILRVVEALQTADCNKASTPANWTPGEPVIIPAPTTFEVLKERKNQVEREKNGISWYLSFKEPNCETKELENIEIKKIESKNCKKK